MTDLQLAKKNLSGHTICLCKDGVCIYSEKRGIAPMMGFLAAGLDLAGYSVADVVVGRAAAFLFVKGGVTHVFAKTLSEGAKSVLEECGIAYEYETLTEKIINRAGTDICPMEKAVWEIQNPDEAYLILKEKLKSMTQTG